MKTAGWVVAALLLGMVLGSWGLKADLRKAKAEIASLKDQVRRGVKKQTHLDGITTMLNIPQSRETTHTKPPPVHGQISVGFHAEAGTNRPGRRPHPGHGSVEYSMTTNQPMPNRSMRENIETAANLWKVRSDLARNSFVSEATTSDSQVARFDVVMAAMNIRISNSIRTWVDFIKAEQTLTPESGVKMMNELSGDLVQAYTDMDREIPEWRDKTEGNLNTMDFVDPQVAMPLTEIEDIMRTQHWDHAESFTNAPGEE
jgi:hypothetical protein